MEQIALFVHAKHKYTVRVERRLLLNVKRLVHKVTTRRGKVKYAHKTSNFLTFICTEILYSQDKIYLPPFMWFSEFLAYFISLIT
jgi:hypothetical protein